MAPAVNLPEFSRRFAALKKKGFVKTLRAGPTGIGYTLETLLELPENNLALPDMPGVEIKAHRDKSSGMITLFTFNSKAWLMPQMEAIQKYGSVDSSNRRGMYYTVSPAPNSAGLFLTVTREQVSVRHISGEHIAAWNLSALIERFEKKIPCLLFVSAHTETRAGVEYFHFYRAQLMQETSGDLLADLFAAGDLMIDMRLHDKGASARNHGTGFRVYEAKLPRLFRKIEDI